MNKPNKRTQGKTVIQTISIRQRSAIISKTDITINEQELINRVRFATELAAQIANQSLRLLWNETAFSRLNSKTLPRMAYRAVEKIISVQKLTNIHLDSRMVWLGEELAGRIARQQATEAQIVQNIIHNIPQPQIDKVWLRNLKRSLRNHERAAGQRAANYFDYKPAPPPSPKHILPLAVTDKQMVKWLDNGSLAVKLPITNQPQTRQDWLWHELPIVLPDYALKIIKRGGQLLTPSLRIKRNRVLLDLVIETDLSDKKQVQETKTVIACDWGERRHLTLTDGWLSNSNKITLSGRPRFFNARGLQAKQAARRRRTGALKKQRDHLDALLHNRPNQSQLLIKREKVEAERVHVWSAYQRCSQQWAHAAARWIIEQAKAIGADTIILEDLKSLEARFSNKRVNERVNHQLRGAVYKLVEHKAKIEGLKIQYVNARGTSKHCPLCRGLNKHHRSSADTSPGRGWSTCQTCNYSRDRDLMAAQHILVRGLRKHQSKTQQDNKPRRAHRPDLTRQKKKRHKLHVAHVNRKQQGFAVRPQSCPRRLPTLSGWRQRDYRNSCYSHRDLHGLQQAYTGRIKLTPTRPVKTY